MCDGGVSEERESQYDYVEGNISQVTGDAELRWEKSYRQSTSPRGAAGRWFPLLPMPLWAVLPSSAAAAQNELVGEPWHRADAIRSAGTVSLQLMAQRGAGDVLFWG